MTLFVFLGRTALTIFQNFKNPQPFYMTVIIGSANFDQKINSEMEVQPVNDLANEDDMNEAGILERARRPQKSLCARRSRERAMSGIKMDNGECTIRVVISLLLHHPSSYFSKIFFFDALCFVSATKFSFFGLFEDLPCEVQVL